MSPRQGEFACCHSAYCLELVIWLRGRQEKPLGLVRDCGICRLNFLCEDSSDDFAGQQDDIPPEKHRTCSHKVMAVSVSWQEVDCDLLFWPEANRKLNGRLGDA